MINKDYRIDNQQDFKRLKKDLLNTHGQFFCPITWSTETEKQGYHQNILKFKDFCKTHNIKFYLMPNSGRPCKSNTIFIYFDIL